MTKTDDELKEEERAVIRENLTTTDANPRWPVEGTIQQLREALRECGEAVGRSLGRKTSNAAHYAIADAVRERVKKLEMEASAARLAKPDTYGETGRVVREIVSDMESELLEGIDLHTQLVGQFLQGMLANPALVAIRPNGVVLFAEDPVERAFQLADSVLKRIDERAKTPT